MVVYPEADPTTHINNMSDGTQMRAVTQHGSRLPEVG